jgi:hypothetical protein
VCEQATFKSPRSRQKAISGIASTTMPKTRFEGHHQERELKSSVPAEEYGPVALGVLYGLG